MDVDPTKRYRFFLGGHDLEMQAIRDLVERHAPGQVMDRGLAWGARASEYDAEIEQAVAAAGERPVLVELTDDLPPWFDRGGLIVVDHHGTSAGETPTALEQVFHLLGLDPRTDWTRWLSLVAANDKAHLRGLRAAAATREEVATVRAADRRAQGLSAEDEALALESIARREVLNEGALTLVHHPTSRTSAVADFMESDLDGPGYANLLILTPGTFEFFGDGAVVLALETAFPGGWCGGDLPRRGFWGHSSLGQTADAADFERQILRTIQDTIIETSRATPVAPTR